MSESLDPGVALSWRILRYRVLLVIAAVVLSADQASKAWIRARLPYNTYGEANGANGYYLDTLFKVDSLGNFTVLHKFGANGDGIGPCCSLVMDRQSNLYGTTEFGGHSSNGVIFKVSTTQ